MRNLRNKPIIVTLDGVTKEYPSVRAFAIAEEFNYQTVLHWLNGWTKPRIDIKISYKQYDKERTNANCSVESTF